MKKPIFDKSTFSSDTVLPLSSFNSTLLRILLLSTISELEATFSCVASVFKYLGVNSVYVGTTPTKKSVSESHTASVSESATVIVIVIDFLDTEWTK